MHVRRTTEMGRGRAIGNGFKVCFRVTCLGNWGGDLESLIGRGIVEAGSVSSEVVMNFGRGETVAWRGLGEGNKRKL